MDAKMIGFGEIEIDGNRYEYDVIIDEREVKKRGKKPSKIYKSEYGHTPLSLEEKIPWGGDKLVIGTGINGRLPIRPEVYEEADKRGIELITLPSAEACRLISGMKPDEIRAVIHITC